MFRGTTPTLIFKFKFDPSILTDAYITLKQPNGVEFEKELCDCEISSEENSISVKLTQAETLRLSCDCPLIIQIRAKTEDGTAVTHKPIYAPVENILKDGEI